MKRLVFATENPGKLAEVQKFASIFGIDVLSPSEAGLNLVTVEETGTTYEQNARLKVQAYLHADIADDLVICGDDTGVEITALGGEPGLHTRRWLGYSMSDDEIVGYTLGRMHTITDRTAEFKCTVAYSVGGSDIQYVTGELKGTIASAPFHDASSQQGFPYRRLFVVDGEPPLPLWRFDELSIEERQGRYSHREMAFKKLFEQLS